MEQRTDTRLAVLVAASASVGAGLIHLAVTPEHWQKFVFSGIFFLAIALFQFLWAPAVFRFPRHRRKVMILGTVVNLASMILWAASRIWGPPLGPAAGIPEMVGVPGVVATMLEAVVVIQVLWFLLPREQPAVLSAGGYRFASLSTVLLMAALVIFGTSAALTRDHEHVNGGGDHAVSEHPAPTNGDERSGATQDGHRSERPSPAPSAPDQHRDEPGGSTEHEDPQEAHDH